MTDALRLDRNRIGEGTVELPDAEPVAVAEPVAIAESQEHVALVIEDDDRAADLLRLLLEAEGFTVLRAVSGEDALEIAPGHDLDLITLDVQLPGMNGWEFLAKIRGHESLAHVPVVVISGTVEPNVALTRGASAILQKPINRGDLKMWLASRGLHEARDQTRTVLVVDDGPPGR